MIRADADHPNAVPQSTTNGELMHPPSPRTPARGTKLRRELIHRDEALQVRASMSREVVDEYAEKIAGGAQLPPVEVFFDGAVYRLAHGFHRFDAWAKLGQDEIDVVVYEGAFRDAMLHALRSNQTHGLRRTAEDKRRAVELLLRDPEWRQWSDRAIAEVAGVDHKTIGAWRQRLTGGEFPSPSRPSSTSPRRGRDGKPYRPRAKTQLHKARRVTPAVARTTEAVPAPAEEAPPRVSVEAPVGDAASGGGNEGGPSQTVPPGIVLLPRYSDDPRLIDLLWNVERAVADLLGGDDGQAEMHVGALHSAMDALHAARAVAGWEYRLRAQDAVVEREVEMVNLDGDEPETASPQANEDPERKPNLRPVAQRDGGENDAATFLARVSNLLLEAQNRLVDLRPELGAHQRAYVHTVLHRAAEALAECVGDRSGVLNPPDACGSKMTTAASVDALPEHARGVETSSFAAPLSAIQR